MILRGRRSGYYRNPVFESKHTDSVVSVPGFTRIMSRTGSSLVREETVRCYTRTVCAILFTNHYATFVMLYVRP